MQVSTSACDPQQSVITLLIFATTCQHGTGQLLDIYLLRPRNNWHSLQFFAKFLLVEDGCCAHSQTRTKFSKLLCCLVSIDVARVHSACVVSIAFLLPPAAEGGCHFFAILEAHERTAASQRRGDRSKSSLPKIKAFISRAPSALSLPC